MYSLWCLQGCVLKLYTCYIEQARVIISCMLFSSRIAILSGKAKLAYKMCCKGFRVGVRAIFDSFQLCLVLQLLSYRHHQRPSFLMSLPIGPKQLPQPHPNLRKLHQLIRVQLLI